MHRIGYLFDKICSLEVIKLAIHNAYKHKRHKRGTVKRVYENIDFYSAQIREMLISGNYKFSEPILRIFHDYNKDRLLRIPRFYPDQVIMWAVLIVVEPVLMRGQYVHSYSGIRGRGQVTAKSYIERCERKCFRRRAYVGKGDIKKYYDHVNIGKLKKLFCRVIKDMKCLALMFAIVDCGGTVLPIGFPTSPLFGNFYLQDCDHYIKERLHIRFYARFADDIILIDFNRRKLVRGLTLIKEFLKNYNCRLKDSLTLWRLFSCPISFVGFMFYKGYTLLRKRLFLNLNRVVRRIKVFGLTLKKAMRYMSLMGWTKRINFRRYYLERIKPVISKGQAKRYISRVAKAAA